MESVSKNTIFGSKSQKIFFKTNVDKSYYTNYNVNINVVKLQNYGNSDGLQSLTGYFANGVVLMLDWTIPQCNKIPKKSLIYRKLQKQNPRALYLNTSLNRQALNELI